MQKIKLKQRFQYNLSQINSRIILYIHLHSTGIKMIINWPVLINGSYIYSDQ